MTYSMALKLNQRFETYDKFLSVFNIESKNNFDVWTKFDLFFLISFNLLILLKFFNKLTSIISNSLIVYYSIIKFYINIFHQEPPIFPTGKQEPPIFPNFPKK